MLLNRATLGLAALASKEVSRYTLQAICIDKDVAVETDGHQLVMITHPTAPIPEDNFPLTPGLVHTSPDGHPILLHRDGALSALKSLPKKGNIPALSHAALSENQTIIVNDLESVSSFSAKATGQFPDYKRVIPTGVPQAEICLNTKLLMSVLKYVADYGDSRCPVVRLTVYDRERPIRLDSRTPDGQFITGVIMPIRSEKSGAFATREAMPAVAVIDFGV